MPEIPASARRSIALITGASSGIGYELAKLFAQDGCDLVLVARDTEALNRIAEQLTASAAIAVTVIATDLARPDAAAELIEELTHRQIEVEILVNNAGFGAFGFFAKTDLRLELDMMQVNMVALTQLTKRLLPGMVKRRRGRILNVASTAAFQPGPLMAVYYATKAYVLSFSEALANELRASGVTVTALCPGLTRSRFQQRAGIERSRLIQSGLMMEAGTVARLGYQGLMRGKTVVIPGMRNRLLVLAIRLVPRNVVTWIVRRVQEC